MRHTSILASTGIMMGFLTSMVGLPTLVEVLIWVGIYTLWVVYGLRFLSKTPVRTMAVASILSGMLCGSIQVVMMEAYQANNPWYAVRFDTSAATELSTAFLIQGISFGLVFGIIAGLLVRWRQSTQA
jgi:hypothetical protein